MAATAKAKGRPVPPVANGNGHAPAADGVLRIQPRTQPAERIPLFYIGDREFTIPKHPGANVAVAYMQILAEDGEGPKAEARAYTYLFREMLGDEGYQALKDCGDLTMPDLARLIGVLVQHTMGALEVPKELPASG